MENDRELKQNFLREKILEKDYDTDEFLNFIINIKGEDAADVDLWTMEELKEVVNKFINQNNPPTKNTNNIKYDSDEEKNKSHEM